MLTVAVQPHFDGNTSGEVLVCPTTDTSWGPFFSIAGALGLDGGGILSHPALTAREHAIPAVVATGRATETLRDGQMVTVDGTTGRVELEETPQDRDVLVLLDRRVRQPRRHR